MAISCVVNASSAGPVFWNGSSSFQNHVRIISTLLILTSVLGAPLNGLALWVLGCRIRRKNRFVVYVLNLLSADFLFLTLQAAHSVCAFAKVDTAHPSLLALRCLIVACNVSSAYLLTWISVERFFGVAFPIWWRLSRTRDSAVMASCVIWALSLGMGVLYGVIRGTRALSVAKEGLVVVEFALAFVGPFLAFLFANAFILCSPGHPSRKTTRLYRAITLNAVVFLLCWAPYHVCVFLYYRAMVAGPLARCVSTFYGAYYSVCLLHVKSCVIPLVYISVSSELKIRLRESLPHIFERRFSEESGLSSPLPPPENDASNRR
ncbi:mas-related G-protein coupled receptor member A-like [Chiloscyllium plagiosum]|uniref:mas-related G-protein coupled receptor member A-like n=1 Tax=Chiloscyllium plagiosum TaxID=36176 RepID=UPI001CB8789F|nr:mas-related G-protein coupled receptor member A-like [Chiloscyllium plagiosum]